MYWGKLSQSQANPAPKTSMGIASTCDSMPASFSRWAGCAGATVREQLPMTTLVAP
jgi:hypothetical protein